jgi:hypothetical protein
MPKGLNKLLEQAHSTHVARTQCYVARREIQNEKHLLNLSLAKQR